MCCMRILQLFAWECWRKVNSLTGLYARFMFYYLYVCKCRVLRGSCVSPGDWVIGSRHWSSNRKVDAVAGSGTALRIRAGKEQRIISSVDCQSHSDLTVLVPQAFVAFWLVPHFQFYLIVLNLYQPTSSRCAFVFIHFLIHLYLLMLVSFLLWYRVHQLPPLLAAVSLLCVQHRLWARDTLTLHNSTSVRFHLLNVSSGNVGHVVMWQKLLAFKSIQIEMDLTLTLLLYLLNSSVLSVSMQPTCLFVFD